MSSGVEEQEAPSQLGISSTGGVEEEQRSVAPGAMEGHDACSGFMRYIDDELLFRRLTRRGFVDKVDSFVRWSWKERLASS